MEIIHVVLGKANPNRMNGVNKVVFQLASQQHQAGIRVSVWGITKDTEASYNARNFPTRLFQAHASPFKIDQSLVQAIQSIQKDTVFHIHGGWIPAFSTLSKLLKKHKIPFILTPHGAYNSIAMKRSYYLKRLYFFLFEKPLLKRAFKIHCIGKSEIQGLETIFKTNKTCLQAYGYETEANKSIHILDKRNEMIVGFVGRLDIYTKGLDLLIEGFDLFHNKHRHSQLWIIGDSDQKAELEKEIAKRKLEDKVILFGSVFGKEKDDLISKMHVFAHPSRNEGLPSSILEAAHLGIPCMISNETNLADQVKHHQAGLVLSNNDAHHISKTLETFYYLWLENKLPTYSLNAKKMVAVDFNWRTVLQNLNLLYTQPLWKQ